MDALTTRRLFLAASLATVTPLNAAETPRLRFPAEPHERLAVSSYPFRSVITPSEKPGEHPERITLAEFAKSLPDRLHVSKIEPWSRHFESTEPAYINQLHASFLSAGIRVVNIPVDIEPTYCDPDPTRQKATLDHYRRWIDVAVTLRSPSIRLHLPSIKVDASSPDCPAQHLKTIADYGASRNIIVNIENDNPVDEDAFRIAKLIDRVNSPYLRALPDFCNSMLAGDADYNYRAVAAMFQHAFNISHVKDMEDDNGKIYRVDLARTFAIAKKANYRGYFSMEWEGDGDPYDGTKHLLAESLRNLA